MTYTVLWDGTAEKPAGKHLFAGQEVPQPVVSRRRVLLGRAYVLENLEAIKADRQTMTVRQTAEKWGVSVTMLQKNVSRG